MMELMKEPLYERSIEYADNRISLFSAQKGKCYVTKREFKTAKEIHCHHKVPKKQGGSDEYKNLVLIHEDIHRLVHATNSKTINLYMEKMDLDEDSLMRINKLRKIANYREIEDDF